LGGEDATAAATRWKSCGLTRHDDNAHVDEAASASCHFRKFEAILFLIEEGYAGQSR
jgi:hypothetical protein